MEKEMTASDAISILNLLTGDGIDVHVDGGWGVDAVLGEQTRSHADLDIAIQHADVPKLRRILESKGYSEIPKEDTLEYNFVLADSAGHEIDVHSYSFDAKGNSIFGIPYPAESLTGTGSIDGYPVDCISPEWVVRFHENYEPGTKDYHDVLALCEKFRIKLPETYVKFREKHNGDPGV